MFIYVYFYVINLVLDNAYVSTLGISVYWTFCVNCSSPFLCPLVVTSKIFLANTRSCFQFLRMGRHLTDIFVTQFYNMFTKVSLSTQIVIESPKDEKYALCNFFNLREVAVTDLWQIDVLTCDIFHISETVVPSRTIYVWNRVYKWTCKSAELSTSLPLVL